MCEVDRDCMGPLVCYTNLTWTKTPFCGCSHFYGGQGPNCEELSVQSYVNASIVGVGMAAILTILGVEILTDCRNAFFRYRVFAYDNTTFTWLYAMCTFLTMFIWCALVLVSALEPSKNSLLPSTDVNGEKLSQYGILERVFLTLSVFFGISGALNVSLSWVDIASKSKRFQKKRDNITFYKRTIRSIQALWVLLVIIQLALGLSVLVLAVGSVLAIGCLITYVFGRVRFISILEAARSRSGSKGKLTDRDSGEKRILRVLNLIRTTSSAVIFALALISVIALSLVAVALDWKEYGQPGQASAYPTLLNSLVLALAIAGSAILYYCHRMFENAIRNKLNLSDQTGYTRNESRLPAEQKSRQLTSKEEDML